MATYLEAGRNVMAAIREGKQIDEEKFLTQVSEVRLLVTAYNICSVEPSYAGPEDVSVLKQWRDEQGKVLHRPNRICAADWAESFLYDLHAYCAHLKKYADVLGLDLWFSATSGAVSRSMLREIVRDCQLIRLYQGICIVPKTLRRPAGQLIVMVRPLHFSPLVNALLIPSDFQQRTHFAYEQGCRSLVSYVEHLRQEEKLMVDSGAGMFPSKERLGQAVKKGYPSLTDYMRELYVEQTGAERVTRAVYEAGGSILNDSAGIFEGTKKPLKRKSAYADMELDFESFSTYGSQIDLMPYMMLDGASIITTDFRYLWRRWLQIKFKEGDYRLKCEAVDAETVRRCMTKIMKGTASIIKWKPAIRYNVKKIVPAEVLEEVNILFNDASSLCEEISLVIEDHKNGALDVEKAEDKIVDMLTDRFSGYIKYFRRGMDGRESCVRQILEEKGNAAEIVSQFKWRCLREFLEGGVCFDFKDIRDGKVSYRLFLNVHGTRYLKHSDTITWIHKRFFLVLLDANISRWKGLPNPIDVFERMPMALRSKEQLLGLWKLSEIAQKLDPDKDKILCLVDRIKEICPEKEEWKDDEKVVYECKKDSYLLD